MKKLLVGLFFVLALGLGCAEQQKVQRGPGPGPRHGPPPAEWRHGPGPRGPHEFRRHRGPECKKEAYAKRGMEKKQRGPTTKPSCQAGCKVR